MKSGWEIKTLGDVYDVRDGTHDSPKYHTTGYPLITSKNLKPEGLSFDNVSFISDQDYIKINQRSAVHRGDVLLAMIGTIGNPTLVDVEPNFAIKNVALFKVPATQSGAFLRYYLDSGYVSSKMMAEAKGTTQKFVGLGYLRDFPINLPPLPEQHRIVGILDEAFEDIAIAKANAEKNLQNARALFESHLHGVDDEKVPLGELVDIRTGKLDANAAVEGGIYPFFTCSRDVYAIDNYAFDCEAILLAGNNAVGDFNVKHYSGKFNAYQRTYVITVNEQQRVLYRFLYFQMLKSLRKFKDQSVGAGTKFLKLGMIKEMEIALPSLADQHKIVATMDSVREETEHLESIYQQKLAALDALKQSLLDQAFKGEL